MAEMGPEDRARMEAGGVLVAELLALGPDALARASELLAQMAGDEDDVSRAAGAVAAKLGAIEEFLRSNAGR